VNVNAPARRPGSEARRIAWRTGAAWAALLVLLLCSWGGAYLHLGGGNLWLGLAIALAKATIVVIVFMHVARGPVVIRLAAVVAVAALGILFLLSGVDFATRQVAPAATQPPQQLGGLAGARGR
jgi:cytochrome c oxidase subunit 4